MFKLFQVRKLFSHEVLRKQVIIIDIINLYVDYKVILINKICRFVGINLFIIDIFKGTVSVDHIKGAIFKSMIFI